MEKLLPALSLGLGLPGGREFLGKYHQDAENQLRLLHYPAVPAEVLASGEKGRTGAHTVRDTLSSRNTHSCDKEIIGFCNWHDSVSR